MMIESLSRADSAHLFKTGFDYFEIKIFCLNPWRIKENESTELDKSFRRKDKQIRLDEADDRLLKQSVTKIPNLTSGALKL